jgi:hypothetical protein
MITAHIVEWFHFVDSNNPVFAGECFFYGAQLGALGGEADASDAVLSHACGEEVVEVVVGHFVPVLNISWSFVRT